MKKLLSILAVSSLVVSTPLTVVACKKEEVIEKIDYNYLINDFVAQTAIIFQSQIYEAFRPWNWISDKQLPPSISMDEIRENMEDLEDKSSHFYKKVSNLIYKIIPTDEINKNLSENMSSNIGYSPIVIDKGTPLKNGIKIESLRGETKGRNFTLYITISTEIFYLESGGLKSSQKVDTFASINILEVPNVLEAGKKINQRFSDVLYGAENANQYSFESDKGNLENTSIRLEKEGVVTEEVKKLVNKIDLETDIEQILEPKLVINNLKTQINHNTVIDSARFPTVDNSWYADWGEQVDNFKNVLKAMSGNKVLEEEYFNDVYSDEYQKSVLYTDWNVDDENDAYTQELREAVEQDPTISKSINQYNLEYNFRNSALKSALVSYKSLFNLNMKEDKKTIALFGATITGVGFELEGEYYDLPNGMVCYRQKTSYENTRALYNDFMKEAFDFQKNLFWIVNRYVPETFEELSSFRYYMQFPKIPQFESNNEEEFTEDILNEIIRYNDKAFSYTEKFDLTSKWTISNTNVGPDKFLFSTKTKALQLFIKVDNNWNEFQLNTYFFSSGLTQYNKPKFFFARKHYTDSLSSDKKKRLEQLREGWSPWSAIY